MWQLYDQKGRFLWLMFTLVSCVVCSSPEFNQNHFGVFFDPFVKQAENGKEYPSAWAYKFENVKTMLTVISKRFSRVFVQDSFSIEENYSYIYTYEYQSLVSLYTAEAAAIINKESGKKLLTVIYEVLRSGSAKQHETAIQLAFEAAEKANRFFSGTVEGIIISRAGQTLQQQLQSVRQHRARASELDIKLGTAFDCVLLLDESNDIVRSIQKQIINESDFIQCQLRCSETRIVPADCFNAVSNHFLKVKDLAYEIRKSTQVIGITEWVNSGLDEREYIDSLKKYWLEANHWASHHKFQIFLKQAFDIQGSQYPESRYMGWWKLKDNAQINSIDGYMEKIYDTDDSVTESVPSINGDVPYPGLSWTQSFVTKLVNGLRPDCPQRATPEIYNVMKDCLNLDPKKRPSFTELLANYNQAAVDRCNITGEDALGGPVKKTIESHFM